MPELQNRILNCFYSLFTIKTTCDAGKEDNSLALGYGLFSSKTIQQCAHKHNIKIHDVTKTYFSSGSVFTAANWHN